MTRFFGAAVFGLMALAASPFALVWPYIGPFLLLGALPLWLLFIVFLFRAAKP
jgi:hypothetical protein